jgi:hypothetical protein
MVGVMRAPILAALLAGLAAAGCGSDPTPVPSQAGTYPGDLRTAQCATHWYTGSDGIATFSCSPAGFRIAFDKPGQDTTLTHIPEAAWMRVDALVRAAPRPRAHPLLDPGIGCFRDAEHGWLAQLGTNSGFLIVEYRSSSAPLARGTSPAVHGLHEWNHLVLTCDATGSGTAIALRVNGTLVAHGIDAGKAVRLTRFSMWAAGERGSALEVRRIAATTR